MWIRALEDEAQGAQPGAARQAAFAASSLEVRMFSVGKGEAIVIVFPGSRAWLIDGGTTNSLAPNEQLAQLLVRYLEDRDLVLEACVASHPHVDHAGALSTILTSGSPALAPRIKVYRAAVAWNVTAKWLERYQQAVASPLVEELVVSTHQELPIADGVAAHVFAGAGAGPYTSLFMQLRYHAARLLFTGDAHCAYETQLLDSYGEADFRADMLKVTHHGSSAGTSTRVLQAIKPAFAIASTADEGGHRLEQDTLERLLGPEHKRRVFETLVDGDIIVRTDGQPYRGGLLYQVEFTSPARFATELDAGIKPRDQIQRTRTDDHDCQ